MESTEKAPSSEAKIVGECASQSVVWLASEQVTCARLNVPPVAEKKWRTMIPWMLEEQLISRADDLELRHGHRNADGSVDVIACARDLLSSITARCVLPDFYLLPWQSDEVSILVLQDRTIVRDGQHSGFAGDNEFISTVLQERYRGTPQSFCVCGDMPHFLMGDDHGFRIRIQPVNVSFEQWPDDCIALKQPVKSRRKSGGNPWLWSAASLSVLVVVTWLISVYLQTARMQEQTDALDAQLRSVYQQMFAERYRGGMHQFQMTVSRRLGGAPVDERWRQVELALKQMGRWVEQCEGCWIENLSLEERSLSMTVRSERTDQPVSANLANVSVESLSEGWLLSTEVGE